MISEDVALPSQGHNVARDFSTLRGADFLSPYLAHDPGLVAAEIGIISES